MMLIGSTVAYASDGDLVGSEEKEAPKSFYVTFDENETEKCINLGDGNYAVVGYTVEQEDNGTSRSLGDSGTVCGYAKIYNSVSKVYTHSFNTVVRYIYGWSSFNIYEKNAWIEPLQSYVDIYDDASYVECTDEIVSSCSVTPHFYGTMFNTKDSTGSKYEDFTNYRIDLTISEGRVSATGINWTVW